MTDDPTQPDPALDAAGGTVMAVLTSLVGGREDEASALLNEAKTRNPSDIIDFLVGFSFGLICTIAYEAEREPEVVLEYIARRAGLQAVGLDPDQAVMF